MGEALANAMLGHRGTDRTYVVAAARAYSFDDVAAALAEASGQPVTYTQISDEEFLAGAAQPGMPEPLARRILGFYSDILDNQLDETSSDLASLLGREPATLVQGLRELFDV